MIHHKIICFSKNLKNRFYNFGEEFFSFKKSSPSISNIIEYLKFRMTYLKNFCLIKKTVDFTKTFEFCACFTFFDETIELNLKI